MARKNKIIIIGGKGYQRETQDLLVECFSWDEIQKIKNIRDYDTLIINLLSKSGEFDGDIIFNQLNIISALEIVQNGGEIIVIGDSRFEVDLTDSESKKKIKHPFLRWTGVNFLWDNSPGDTIIFEDDYRHRSFKDYISNLSKWDYSLRNCYLDKERVMQLFNPSYFKENNYRIDIDIDKFCYNRCNNAIAFSIKIGIFSNYKEQTPLLCGPIIFLPKIDKNDDEAIQIVLRDICGVEAELPEPEWLNDYTAPGQKEIDKKIEKILLSLNTAFQDLKRAQEEREKIRTCLKLLYEREYALEPATRDILRALGANVEDPPERGKEDGWIVVSMGDKNYEGVLEVKSTKSDQFDEDGRKQLLDWIDRGIRLRQKKYKGIFIGNSAVDKPLKERPWAFSNNWQKNAQLSEICAIKTEDLYFIYLLKENSRLDINKFWQVIFQTNGIFDIKGFLPTQKKE